MPVILPTSRSPSVGSEKTTNLQAVQVAVILSTACDVLQRRGDSEAVLEIWVGPASARYLCISGRFIHFLSCLRVMAFENLTHLSRSALFRILPKRKIKIVG